MGICFKKCLVSYIFVSKTLNARNVGEFCVSKHMKTPDFSSPTNNSLLETLFFNPRITKQLESKKEKTQSREKRTKK